MTTSVSQCLLNGTLLPPEHDEQSTLAHTSCVRLCGLLCDWTMIVAKYETKSCITLQDIPIDGAEIVAKCKSVLAGW